MRELDLISVLEQCGCRRVRAYGDEVRSTCPEEANHSRGMDRNPSFSARINPDGYSPYFCQACGLKGTVEYLALEHGMPQYMPEKGRKYDPEDWFPAENRKLWGGDEETCILMPPEELLRRFQGGIPRYLVERGVELETAKRWELGFDREFKRAMFTIRDRLGRFRGVCGRALFKQQKPKYCHYSWDTREEKLVPWVDYNRHKEFLRVEKRLICYGENMVQAPVKRLLVTEGHLDVVLSDQAGVPAVGLQGSKPSDEQVATILELLDRDGELVVGLDQDQYGREGRDELIAKLDGRVPLFDPRFPEGKDPADLVLEDPGAYCELVASARVIQC